MTIIKLSEQVADALAENRPVVALESTIISHGFPRPQNLEVAHTFEKTLTDMDVAPATIALIDGVPHVGLDSSQIDRIANDTSVIKVSGRDLGLAMTQKVTGATTVAATSILANAAGIRVFSTGGLGGVHRGASASFDESADLTTLSRTPITVVAAGVKSILDIPATLERLETMGITVAGYRTAKFPGFYLSDSGYGLGWRIESAGEVAQIMAHRDELELDNAIVIANPPPTEQQLDPKLHDEVYNAALAAADENDSHGKDVTPFPLAYLQEHTYGASMIVNKDISVNNIRLGGEIATAWANR